MCKNCNCGTDERVEAVKRKIERIIGGSLDRLEQAITSSQINVSEQIGEINTKLFDGITKKDLVASIVNEYDELDFEGLIARDDVQEALKQSERIKQEAFQKSFEIGGKIHECEIKINELANELMDDVLIFGVTDAIVERISQLDSEVDEVLATIV